MDLRNLFSKARIAILGDVMLDQYWWGTVDRISPEAPVPVVRMENETVVPGGAANVAMNVVGLGAQAILIGCVGQDTAASLLRDNLNLAQISSKRLVIAPDRPTSLKTRIVAHNQHVVRVDRESRAFIDQRVEKLVLDNLDEALPSADLLIISDYAKGTLSSAVLSSAIRSANERGIPVLTDPKGKDYSKYRGVTLITPNRREAADACSLDEHGHDVVTVAGKRLVEELGLKAIIITEGEKGMTLFQRDGNVRSYGAEAHEIFDVTGAGDTVIATLGVAMAAGLSLEDSVRVANTAASLVVEQVGTTSVSIEKLERKLEEQRTNGSELAITSL